MLIPPPTHTHTQRFNSFSYTGRSMPIPSPPHNFSLHPLCRQEKYNSNSDENGRHLQSGQQTEYTSHELTSKDLLTSGPEDCIITTAHIHRSRCKPRLQCEKVVHAAGKWSILQGFLETGKTCSCGFSPRICGGVWNGGGFLGGQGKHSIQHPNLFNFQNCLYMTCGCF